MDRIAVLDDFQGRAHEFADWASLGVPVQFFTEQMVGAALTEALADFDVVVANRERTAFPAAVIGALPNLRLLVTTGMANAAIDLDAARAAGIVVCGTDSSGRGTTEVTWALILASVKHLPAEDRALRSGRWQTTLAGDLAGRCLGLIGLGRLGAAMVPIARAFSMEVVAWSEHLTAERASGLGVEYASRDELFSRSDVVSIHLRLSQRTEGLVGRDEIALMRPGTLLVNTSRGPIVDEKAMIEALEQRRINAALDVYDLEPLPAGHPLTALDNVVLSPHLGYASENNFRLFYSQAVEDIAAFSSGAPLRVLNAGA